MAEDLAREDGPSLRAVARALYASRHDPNLEVDMRIAAAMSGVRWISGGVLTMIMRHVAPDAGDRGRLGGRSPRRSFWRAS